MKFCLGFILLVVFAAGTLAEDEFDLSLALDEDPAEKPTEKPKPPPQKPNAGGDKGFHLESALDTDPKPADKPAVKPADKPSKGGEGELDLGDALLPDLDPKPDKPAVKPPKSGGGGGSFDDSDLFELAPNKPDGGHSAGGRAVDPAYDPNGGADQPQEAGSGQIAGIVSAIGVALFGAASSYFAYQKKKLCFKVQGGADLESGKGQRHQSDPQVLSNLLRTS